MSDNKLMGSDDRLKKSMATPVRGDRVEADAERVLNDGTALTMEERRLMKHSKSSKYNKHKKKKVEGWHYCWLSTTNSTDPIYKRMQKGYEPVKAHEVPGFGQYSIEQGEFEGCVACNEMLLYKIPLDVYQDVMAHFHHEAPLEEANKIRVQAERIQGRDSSGKQLGQVEGEGMDNIDKPIPAPQFAG